MSDPTGSDVVVFRIGDRRLAVDARDAVAVTRPEPPTRLRSTVAPGLVGLAAVRGAIVAVVDPRPGLGLDPLDIDGDPSVLRNQHLLVTIGDGGRFGLLVDEVESVTSERPDGGDATALDELLRASLGPDGGAT